MPCFTCLNYKSFQDGTILTRVLIKRTPITNYYMYVFVVVTTLFFNHKDILHLIFNKLPEYKMLLNAMKYYRLNYSRQLKP